MADHCADCQALKSRIRELEAENAYLQMFKFGMDNMPFSGFAILSREHRFAAVSQGYLDAYHLKPEEIIGKKAADVLGKHAFQTVAEPCFAQAMEGKTTYYSSWVEMPDSQERLLTIHCFPIPNQGTVYQVGILIHDLTEIHEIQGASMNPGANCRKTQQKVPCPGNWTREIEEKKQIREALKKSEARYRDLFESAPVMYVVLENHHGDAVLRDCNALFLDSLGYTRAEVTGWSISQFYTADSREKMYREQNLRRIRENTFSMAERELLCRDGEIIHTLVQAKTDMNEHGELIGIRCMFTNISAQKRAQEQLRESNHLLTMILDGICEPLIILDRNMGVLMMNRAAEIYAGRAGSQCLGQNCHKMFKSAPRPCAGCFVGQVLGSGCKKQYERAGLMNSDLLEQVTVYPIRENGYHTWAAIVRVSDITLERQMKKELIQADKMISLGILVSGMAHEINNPNHLIMSNTPLLIDAWQSSVPVLDRYYRKNGDFSLGGLPYSRMREEIPQLFEGIIEGSVRIHQIVKDLKDYARKEEVDMDQDVDLNHVVKNAVRLTRNLIDEKTDSFSLAYGSSLPMVRGNLQKLEQVVINLIQNACQAISDRDQGLEITTFLEPDRNCLCVRVRDQGHGIPESLLDRIMDPFFTTRRGQGGTGLGLAVCLNIVTTHEGKIEVTSKPGQGSVFTVSLPLNAAPKTCLYDQTPG